ncbi:MAG TPA: biopolymer transporter ExbB [Prolixibacteraceae bacterium]|nr:biopolymer transporter ExbB [Prolixibacteraceae bacterium]
MLNFLLLQTSQNIAEGSVSVGDAIKPEGLTNVLYHLFLNGGPGMIPVVFLSVVALLIFLERIIVISHARKLDPLLLTRLREYILAGHIESAFNLCHSENTPCSRMIEKGISNLGRSIEEVSAIIKNAGNMEISKLEKGLPVLASVVGGAPMLGILATVLALIQAFYEMANSEKMIDMPLLATFVYQALVTTVAGLIVGIVAYFAYNILVASVERVIFHLEAATCDFLEILNEPAH